MPNATKMQIARYKEGLLFLSSGIKPPKNRHPNTKNQALTNTQIFF